MTFLYDLLELYKFSNTIVGTAAYHMTEPIKYLRKTMQVMREDHQCAIREDQMCLSQKEPHGGAQWMSWVSQASEQHGCSSSEHHKHPELCTRQQLLDTSAFAVNLYHRPLSSVSVHRGEGSYPLDFSLS